MVQVTLTHKINHHRYFSFYFHNLSRFIERTNCHYMFRRFLQQTFMSYYYVQRYMFSYTLHTILPSQNKPLSLSFIILAEERIITLSFPLKEDVWGNTVSGLYVLLSRVFQHLCLQISGFSYHRY